MMLVSILIPCHNCAGYIGRCVHSVLRQTYSNLQIVVIDDGSTDDSLSEIEKIVKSDSRVEYLSQPLRGVADARNAALDMSRGEAVMFIDADDWIEPNTIEILLRHLIKDNLDFCACSMVRDSESDHSPIFATHFDYELCTQSEAIHNFLSQRSLQGSVCNKLIRRSSIGTLRFQSGWNYAEDTMFVWQLLQHINRCGQISKILYHYCLTPNSLTEALYSDSHLTYITMWEQVCHDVQLRYQSLYLKAYSKMGNAIASVLYDIARTGIERADVEPVLRKKLRQCLSAMASRQNLSLRYLVFALTSIYCSPLSNLMAKLWHKFRN